MEQHRFKAEARQTLSLVVREATNRCNKAIGNLCTIHFYISNKKTLNM